MEKPWHTEFLNYFFLLICARLEPTVKEPFVALMIENEFVYSFSSQNFGQNPIKTVSIVTFNIFLAFIYEPSG